MHSSFESVDTSDVRPISLIQGRNEGGTIPRAENHYGDAESLQGTLP